MNEEKQIEEMAWVLCDIPRHPSIKSCEQCGNKHCHAIYYAERAINADYRKQNEGEWIWKSNGYKNRLHCSICNKPNEADISTNFCPNCGAKMKGGE